MSESREEQFERVRLMAIGDPTWDLSDNDKAALLTVLRAAVRADHPLLTMPEKLDNPEHKP